MAKGKRRTRAKRARKPRPRAIEIALAGLAHDIRTPLTGILALSYGQHSDRFETKPDGPDVPQLRDRTLTPFSYYGGYGVVFGPTVNNHSNRNT